MATKTVMKIQKHIALFLGLLMIAIMILVGRIGWIQFIDGKRMTAQTDIQLKESKILHSPAALFMIEMDENWQSVA